MIPASLIAEHAAVQAAVSTLASGALLGVWRQVDLADAETATAALRVSVPPIVETYGELSAVTAAEFYDTARSMSDPPGRFQARAGGIAPLPQVHALVGWAVTPLWSQDPDAATALAKLSGGLSRLVRQSERTTIYDATLQDPAGPRYARVTSGDPCPFCAMLASRGGVYRSAESATGFHDSCRCTAMPVWRDDDLPERNRELADEWDRVTRGQPDAFQAWAEHIGR